MKIPSAGLFCSFILNKEIICIWMDLFNPLGVVKWAVDFIAGINPSLGQYWKNSSQMGPLGGKGGVDLKEFFNVIS